MFCQLQDSFPRVMNVANHGKKGDYSMTGDVTIAGYVTMIRPTIRTTANGSW